MKLPSLTPVASAVKAPFELLPDGDYLVHVIRSAYEPTQAGKALKLTLQILQGPHRNRRLWVAMCLEHPKPDVKAMAWREYAALLDAVGNEGELTETEQLHDIPFMAKVSNRPAANGYPAKNSAGRFRKAPADALDDQLSNSTGDQAV